MTDLRQQLEALIGADGRLHPETVVAAAKDEASPLHHYFTWSDTEAAAQWRLEEARKLIRSVVIHVPDNPHVKVRAFVSLPTDRANGEGYRSLESIMDSQFLLAQLMQEIDSTISAWQKRADILGAFLEVKINRARSSRER